MTEPGPSSMGALPTALAGRIQAIVDAALSLVPRALHLPDMLEAQLLHTDVAALLRALQDMHHAVTIAQPEAPKSRWRRSWPFRRRHAATQLRSRVHDALRTQAPVRERAQALRSRHEPQLLAARHTLERLERSRADLEPRVRQAQELLAELWDTLRPQRPDPEDHEFLEHLRAQLADIDRHRVAVQRLDGVSGAAMDVVRLGEAVLGGRHEVLDLLGPPFDAAWARWRVQVEPLTQAGLSSQEVLDGSDQALAARGALLMQVDKVRVACTRLQIDEQALAQGLVHLRDQLAPFARN